jgi:polar amino acid transport system permease protein
MDVIATFREIWVSRQSILTGVLTTVEISFLVIILGTLGGLLAGLVLVYGRRLFSIPVRAFVDIVRGVPLLVLLFFSFYVTSMAGVNVSPFMAGVWALSLACIAQMAEIARGAIQSIPQAQTDTAKAIGLGFWGRLRYAILPQALRRMLPAWVNVSAEIVKASTLLSLIGVLDLLASTQQLISRTYLIVELYTFVLLVYFIINFGISRLGAEIERRMSYVRY